MNVIKAPSKIIVKATPIIFLAGSIEQGKAEKWQGMVAHGLRDHIGTILDPRRDEWDSSWEQEMGDNQFTEQVQWELSAMEKANEILMYFDPDTKSPITLLELGLHARSGRLTVCCPKGFWRKGNVDIVCNRYGVRQVDTLEQLIDHGRKISKKSLDPRMR
jgi:hypothetical protein